MGIIHEWLYTDYVRGFGLNRLPVIICKNDKGKIFHRNIFQTKSIIQKY